MALCLAISLIVRHDFSSYDQLVRYKLWHKKGYMSSTGQCFDIGASTRQALQEFERRQRQFAQQYQIPFERLDYLADTDVLLQFDANCGKSDAAGNGALMRLAPIPLFFWQDPKTAVKFSGYSALTTHGDRKVYDACRFYGALIVAAIHGATKTDLLHRDFYERHKDWFGTSLLHEDIKRIAEGSYKKKNGYEDGIRGKGYIIDSLKAALWAFWSDEDSFEKGVLAAVNLGDDADTTAAIYGQLAGVYYGYASLPERWVKHIYARKFLTCLSKWIVYEGDRWFKNGSSNSTTHNPKSKL
jgi:ADP-ribosyl-[dinitrogen reductase] hydrolase